MPITQRSCTEIAGWLREGRDFRFVDVRTEMEWDIARLEGAERLTGPLLAELEALPRHTPLAFLCHHGVRSQQAARHFEALGFTDVSNVVGGIDQWSVEVDPTVPRY